MVYKRLARDEKKGFFPLASFALTKALSSKSTSMVVMSSDLTYSLLAASHAINLICGTMREVKSNLKNRAFGQAGLLPFRAH